MKKLLLITGSLALISTSVFAQPRKGDWMVGAQVFPFEVKMGYFLSNRWILGTEVAPALSFYNNSNPVIAANISASPYIRYYFAGKEGMQTNKFYLFADYNFSYSYGFSRDLNGTVTASGGHFNTGIAPGTVYHITDRFSADAAIRVNCYGIGIANSGVNISTQYELGIQMYLKGRKKQSDVAEMRGS